MRDLPCNLPPLSKGASKAADDVEELGGDVDPISATNISANEACQILPLLI